jgi:hypothetical protein
MNTRALIIATGLGLAGQLAMVVSGHYVAFIKDNVFAIGGMLISLVAGLVYARLAAGSWGDSLAGGLVAGGACALVAIALSVAMKDTPTMILAFGTLGSALAGAVGGALGKLV